MRLDAEFTYFAHIIVAWLSERAPGRRDSCVYHLQELSHRKDIAETPGSGGSDVEQWT